MRKLVLVLLLGIVLWPLRARSQAEISLSYLQIDLWPEFDHPGVLVIYHMELSAETALPARLTLRIPAAAGKPNAVAVGDSAASVADTPYDYRINGSWGEISFTALSPVLQLEYYDPALEKQAKLRRFVYGWAGDYTARAVIVSIQQPFGVREMRISPGFTRSLPASDGLTYYIVDAGQVRQGQAFTISLEYEKESDALTAEFMPVQPSGPLPASENRIDVMQALPWLMGGAGVILLFGGVGWYFFSGRGTLLPRRVWRGRKPLRRSAAEASNAVYCHQCGKRAEPGDRFCRTCGTALRIE